jgi:hypothetical protein
MDRNHQLFLDARDLPHPNLIYHTMLDIAGALRGLSILGIPWDFVLVSQI